MPSHLTAWELADLRATLALGFDKSCTISTPIAPTDDGAGGETDGTPTTVGVNCKKGRLSGDELVIAERLSARTDWRLTLPYGTVVAPECSVTVDGLAYGIAWTSTGESDALGIRCLVRRDG